jgi:NAD+ kinase
MKDRARPRAIESVTIVAKRGQPEAAGAARRVAKLLKSRGLAVGFDRETARALGRPRDGREIGGGTTRPADLYVVFGGDGTLLRVARSIAAMPRPILGVNLGGLGFLTETSLAEAAGVLEEILDGRYAVDRRMGLDVVLRRAGRTVARQAVMNDVVINKSALARIIDLGVTIDGQFVTNYKADGLIVATPTGSTAYSLSAGGPLIHPDMEALLIAPICPHTLSMRPLVVPDRSRVEITLRTGDSEVYLTLDGQVGHPLRSKDRVRVRRSRLPILMVRSPRTTYFEILRHKLHWGKR